MDAFNVAIEHLEPNKWFLLRIRIESISYSKRIIPIVGVPAAKGEIVTNFELCDCNGNLTSKKTTKILGIEVKNDIFEYECEYFSSLGILSVEYECDYFDVNTNLNKREASSTGRFDFAMRRQVVDECTIKYYCKSPISNSFDALIFSLHWEENRASIT